MTEVLMQVVACLVGDYDNVFCLCKICLLEFMGPRSFFRIHKKSFFFKRIPEPLLNTWMAHPEHEGGDISLITWNSF